ncbi:MAG TPA: hypothetical protein VHT03_01270 [Rhizomicrobium sp.]|jgi:hypothetical protein|nr:hypothetical protein [Rhizomicrobium sp.]
MNTATKEPRAVTCVDPDLVRRAGEVGKQQPSAPHKTCICINCCIGMRL